MASVPALALVFIGIHLTVAITSNVTIDCPINSACYVHCIGQDSCLDSIINCPDDASCTVDCVGEDSCLSIIIDASKSSEFVLNGCADPGACIGVTIYCPPNFQGTAKCTIYGM